jgi:hypothetical protein
LRIAEVLFSVIASGLEPIAVFILDLQGVALPDRVSEVVDQVENGEGLLGRPVGWDLQREMVRGKLVVGLVMTCPCGVSGRAARSVPAPL